MFLRWKISNTCAAASRHVRTRKLYRGWARRRFFGRVCVVSNSEELCSRLTCVAITWVPTRIRNEQRMLSWRRKTITMKKRRLHPHILTVQHSSTIHLYKCIQSHAREHPVMLRNWYAWCTRRRSWAEQGALKAPPEFSVIRSFPLQTVCIRSGKGQVVSIRQIRR